MEMVIHMKKELNVGFITTLSGRWPIKLPEKRREEYGNWLDETFPDLNIVKADRLIDSGQAVDQTVERFRRESVDVLVMVYGAFTGDDIPSVFAEELGIPVLLWAPYEPPFDRDDRLYANALVAATMNAASLKRLGHTSHVIYGGLDDGRARSRVQSLIRAYSVIKKLNGTLLGLLGYRPTAFYNSTFDEGLIRRTFGVRIEETDLAIVFDRMGRIPEDQVRSDMEGVSGTFDTSRLPKGHLENHSRLYFALKEIMGEKGYDYATIKCWPEMGELHTTPCAVMGRLADEDSHLVCEGDVDAALALVVENYLTGLPAFICDMINIDETENLLTYWHCGNAALSLFDKEDGVTINDHPLAGQGTAFYGALKPGKVTVARFCNIDGQYKLFLVSGEAVKTKRNTGGVMVNVRPKAPVRGILERIIREGVPHHYSIVWQDVAEEMKTIGELLGLEIIECGDECR